MKKLPLMLIIGCISATISCRKDVAGTDNLNNAVSIQSSTVSDAVVPTGIQFGAWIGGNLSLPNKAKLCTMLGVNYVRTTIILTKFHGSDAAVEQYLNNGKKVILNLNYQAVRNNPNPFPKDMNKYRNLLEAALQKYAKRVEVVVIENEPTTDQFHKGPMSDYIAMLKVAVQSCRKYGVKVADGGIHPENIKLVMHSSRLSGNAAEVKQLITAYKGLDLDYVNIHAHGDGSSYPGGQLKDVADYIRRQTGHAVMNNEFSLHSTSTSLVRDMVAGFKQGGYKYAIVFSGESDSGAVPLNSGLQLRPNGVAYKDAIK
jgi:hypothetical protein